MTDQTNQPPQSTPQQSQTPVQDQAQQPQVSQEQAPTQQPEPEPQRPVETLRDGAIKASVWRNEGENGPYYATSISRTYTHQEGNARDTNSFIGTDLLKVGEIARSAYERTREMRREEFVAQRQDQAQTQQHSRNRNRGQKPQR